MLRSNKRLGLTVLAFAVSMLVGSVAAADKGHGKKFERRHMDMKHLKRKVDTVPELDASGAGAAVAMVLGGAAVVLGRRRRTA